MILNPKLGKIPLKQAALKPAEVTTYMFTCNYLANSRSEKKNFIGGGDIS